MKMVIFPLILAAAIAGIFFLRSEDAQATGVTAVASPVIPDAEDKAEIVEESMHEFMEYVFQPTYRRLKASMASEPSDNADWKAVKSDSLILAESCNLLFVRLPDENASDWTKHATASRTHGAALYRAARAKDFSTAADSYRLMLKNCNACHRQFENGKHILVP